MTSIKSIKPLLISRTAIKILLGIFILVLSGSFQSPVYAQNKELSIINEVDGYVAYKYNSPGEEFERYIMKPPGKGPFPAIIVNHGGGGSGKSVTIIDGFPFPMANAGYVLIAADLTHSAPLDKQKDHSLYGGSDENIERSLKNIEILKNIDFVDAERIGMYGFSMGGFCTVAALSAGEKAKDIKVAVIEGAGLASPKIQHKNSDHINKLSIEESRIKNIACPVLLVHGENDQVASVAYAKHLKNVLDSLGKEVDIVIFKNSGHVNAKFTNGKSWETVITFFNKHLK